MRNKLIWFGAFLLIATLFTGCTWYEDEGNANPPEENENTETNKDADSSDELRENVDEIVDAPYSFLKIEVEVDIDGVDDALEMEYEVKRSKIKASYKDKSKKIDIKDEEAMNKLESILDGFTFDENSSEDEIIKDVIEGFSIDEYDEIEIEINFKDMTEIEIEQKQ